MASELQTLSDIKNSGGGLNPVQQTRYDQLIAAGSSGNADGVAGTNIPVGSTGLLPFPNIKLSDIGGSATDYADKLSSQENDIFGNYLKIAQSQPLPLDLYDKLETAAGIPQLKQSQSTLQGQIYNLEDTLRRVEPNVTARTGSSVVTEAQRQGMVSAAQKPLIENLGWLGQSLGRVSSAISTEKQDIGNKVTLAMQGFQQQLEPYKMQLTMKMDQDARAMTGFTADRETTLNILLAKIARDEQISDMQWKQAQDLAMQEREFEQAKSLKMIEINQPDNKVVEANGRQLLVDQKTGKIISDLGSSKAPGTGGTGSGIFTGASTPTSSKPTSTPTSTPYNTNLYNYLFGGASPTSGGSAKLK